MDGVDGSKAVLLNAFLAHLRGAVVGCDIHSTVQVLKDGKWETVTDRIFPLDDTTWDKQTHTAGPFYWRNYGVFGFLADVRNYSEVPPIAEPRGFPPDMPDEISYLQSHGWTYGDHSFSWLGLKELLDFDYEKRFSDKRESRLAIDLRTYRDLLGNDFFRDLEIMRGLADDPSKVRVVFGFDN